MQLLLLKRGGQVIYSGKLGRNSQKMIEYFEVHIILHYDVYFSVVDPICMMKNKSMPPDLLFYTTRQFLECLKSKTSTTPQHGCLKSVQLLQKYAYAWILLITIRLQICTSKHDIFLVAWTSTVFSRTA